MPDTLCTACHRPTGDGALLCKVDQEQYDRALVDVPGLLEELDTTATRQDAITRVATGARPVRDATDPDDDGRPVHLPLNTAALTARHRLAKVLSNSVHTFATRGTLLTAGPGRTGTRVQPTDFSWWLLDHMHEIRHHPEAGDRLNDLLAARAVALRAIDRPDDTWYAGICSAPYLGKLCQTGLYVAVGASVIRCPVCGTRHDVHQRREFLLRAARDVLGTPSEIVAAAATWGGRELRRGRLAVWASRGRLMKRGQDGSTPLYRLGDVLDLLAADDARTAELAAARSTT